MAEKNKSIKPKGATTQIVQRHKTQKTTSIGKSKFSRLSKAKKNWKTGKKKSRGQG